jgi:hypothetical protein
VQGLCAAAILIFGRNRAKKRMVEKKWAARVRNSRLMLFTRAGEARLREAFF